MRAFLKRLWNGFLITVGVCLLTFLLVAAASTDGAGAARERTRRVVYTHDDRAGTCFAEYPLDKDGEAFRPVAVACTPEVLRLTERR
jgi:hypothetical protein